MSAAKPTHFLVKAERNNVVVQIRETASHEEAIDLKNQFEQTPRVTAEIVEVHDRSETDLTTHTRELVEDLTADRHP